MTAHTYICSWCGIERKTRHGRNQTGTCRDCQQYETFAKSIKAAK